jgi:hypothetical protein
LSHFIRFSYKTDIFSPTVVAIIKTCDVMDILSALMKVTKVPNFAATVQSSWDILQACDHLLHFSAGFL